MYAKVIKKKIASRSYTFSAAYGLLDSKARKRVRAAALKELGMSEMNFRGKMRGNSQLYAWQADALRAIFAREGITKFYNYEYEEA